MWKFSFFFSLELTAYIFREEAPGTKGRAEGGGCREEENLALEGIPQFSHL
jgi:hypothetical protein